MIGSVGTFSFGCFPLGILVGGQVVQVCILPPTNRRRDDDRPIAAVNQLLFKLGGSIRGLGRSSGP